VSIPGYDRWKLRSDFDECPPEEREEPCDWCDEDGWIEGLPIPTPHGPHYPVSRCSACGGTHRIAVELFPLEQTDLDLMAGAEP
jgi:hypothetical protein